MTNPLLVDKDLEAGTLTLTATFRAPVARVWQVWANPRLLERWWGPPTYPATFVDHDLRPGGIVTYFMTGPEGDKHHGWWRIRSVDAPTSLELVDGFGDGPDDAPADMPTSHMRMTLRPIAGDVTEMVLQTTFASRAAMEQLVSMGMVEGITAAIGQIDALLVEQTAPADRQRPVA